MKYGDEGSRIDFMLQAEDRPECYIEVKSVTLAEQENGFFPDAVTLRGQKHLRELMSVAAAGKRAVLLLRFCIQPLNGFPRPVILILNTRNC